MRNVLFTAVLLCVSTPVFAAHWSVDTLTSKLMFTAEQSGETIAGSFPKFDSTIDFDEAKPETASIHIAITMAALQVDGKDAMDALPTADWFNVKQFPFAEFTSTSVKKTGEHQFAATGKLNIRGVTREVTLPFALDTVGKSTVAKGKLTISRKDFGIGQGRFASDEWVKYPVDVTFEIHAAAQ